MKEQEFQIGVKFKNKYGTVYTVVDRYVIRNNIVDNYVCVKAKAKNNIVHEFSADSFYGERCVVDLNS